ncbi:MAG TPA: tRNA (5-methylaminomethyl-2-thiouridylate)-methyltransferase [Opitutaceae bacterium]|nr:tRNA (5-methylaminomethyl-2-thiouridylate)-methyltransferase [Opitutaceae bacterium]
MATTYPAHVHSADEPAVVRQTSSLLKYILGAVPIIAGADKFSNFLTRWEDYLNPFVPQTLHLTAATFMHLVGIIEIVAGVIVFIKPRLGGFIVMAWLIAISLQLIFWGHYLDIAVRDLVIALTGALTLARLTPFAHDVAETH